MFRKGMCMMSTSWTAWFPSPVPSTSWTVRTWTSPAFISFIFTFIEENAKADLWNHNRPHWNQPIEVRGPLDVMRCPSDEQFVYPTDQDAKGNYGINWGQWTYGQQLAPDPTDRTQVIDKTMPYAPFWLEFGARLDDLIARARRLLA